MLEKIRSDFFVHCDEHNVLSGWGLQATCLKPDNQMTFIKSGDFGILLMPISHCESYAVLMLLNWHNWKSN